MCVRKKILIVKTITRTYCITIKRYYRQLSDITTFGSV